MYQYEGKKVESQKKGQNKTGLPDHIKERAEGISGFSMDSVRVHKNSDKPNKVGALAYTQGTQIYLGHGQENHLGHELAHVVQQMQGRVPVTSSVNGQPLNDDASLEKEADNMF